MQDTTTKKANEARAGGSLWYGQKSRDLAPHPEEVRRRRENIEGAGHDADVQGEGTETAASWEDSREEGQVSPCVCSFYQLFFLFFLSFL